MAFAPERVDILVFPCVAVLLYGIERPVLHRQAFLNAFAFGVGLYLFGTGWMHISLNQYGGLALPLAWSATVAACLALAAFLALAAIAGRLAAARIQDRFTRLLAIAAVWSILETYLRTPPAGTSISDIWFPWMPLGHTQVPDGLLSGFIPLVGVQGVSVMTALAGAALAAIASSIMAALRPAATGSKERSAWAAPALVVALYAGTGIAGQHVDYVEPGDGRVSVSLLQGNIPQEHKWVAANRSAILAQYTEMIAQSEGRLVVLPETAIPVIWENLDGDMVESYRALGEERDGTVLLGAFELNVERNGLHNSAFALGEAGVASHRKIRLAPFGEFIPFGFLFAWAAELFDIPYSELSRGSPPHRLVSLPFGDVLVAICYEDAFPETFRNLSGGAAFLVNMTNGAWFGKSRMLDQHLQISQARALETGRQMVRSTNTGSTAHIDHRGRVIAELPRHEVGLLEVEVTPYAGTTPFVERGKLLLVVIMALTFVSAWGLKGR